MLLRVTCAYTTPPGPSQYEYIYIYIYSQKDSKQSLMATSGSSLHAATSDG